MTSRQRTVLVTGASTGIGRAIAERLAADGYRVVAGMRRPEACEAPAGCQVAALDVTDPVQAANFVAIARDAAPDGLFALVNNAGQAAPSPAELIDHDELRRLMEVNVVGPLRLMQQCLPLLRAGRGRIINVTSMNGAIALPMVGAYSASKFALEALSDTLRVELRPWAVSVSAIRPGQVRTPIFAKALAAMEARQAVVPPELAPGYDPLFERAALFARYGERAGVAPEAVARAVAKALAARWPRAHYHVGADVQGLRLLRACVPTRIFDRLIARALGVFRRLPR